MSPEDDRDLSAAFEELSAPPSTANYASRTPTVEIRTTRIRWPQALATALAVLVAVAGAGTFLALRSARQGGSPSSSAGAPAARWDAAMAYDSTAGVTVMFGGTNVAGKPLTDTWTWNGSAWTAATGGPASLVDVRMVDDPADGGVLLLGTVVPGNTGSSAGGSSGCVVGSAGGSTGPGTTTVVPPSAASPAPGKKAAPPTGPPLGEPLPSAVSIAPSSTCEPIAPIPSVSASEQTWLFRDGGWTRVDAGSTAVTPPTGTQLTFDATTRQVVAASTQSFRCGGPPYAAPTDAAIACPLLGSSSSSGSAPVRCGATAASCVSAGGISTWTWSHGEWAKAPVDATTNQGGYSFLFEDPATRHATLMTQSDLPPSGDIAYPASPVTCAPGARCAAPLLPLISTWTWTGTAWQAVSTLQNHQSTPDLAGANLTTVGSHIVVLTAAGQTWTWAAGQWIQQDLAAHPASRVGASMSQGPGGSVVLFGGTFGLGVTAIPGSVGSDTWTWDGTSWRQVGGTQPSAPAVQCPPLADGSIPPCVPPGPAHVAPASAPATAPTTSP